MADVLIWYAIIMLLGLLALPFSFAIFHRLPDRGYAFSKPLGLLMSGLLVWWVGSLKLLPFLQVTAWIGLAEYAVLGSLLLFFHTGLRRDLLAWFRAGRNWRYALGCELVFLAAFAFMVNARSFFPNLDQSEKFFDLAFINSPALSPDLPPPDPWFGGRPMNYYYGGLYLIGFLCKLAATEASTGYNIAMGVVFGLAACSAYGLAGNLTGLARGAGRVSSGAALAGATFMMFLGNLYPLRQALTRGILPLDHPDFPFRVDWPASARMIYDPMPDGRLMDILTEYPIYSYLNGDLHAHLLGTPYLLMALGFLLHVFVVPGKWALAKPGWAAPGGWLAAAMLTGGLYWINAGDFIPVALLGVAVTGLAEWRADDGHLRLWRGLLLRWGVQLFGLGLGIYLVYLHYFNNFSGLVRSGPLEEYKNVPFIGFMSRYVGWISWPRTFLMEYLLMFGFFLLAVVTFYSLKLAQLWRLEQRPAGAPLLLFDRVLLWIMGLSLVGLAGFSLSRTLADMARRDLKLVSFVLPLICLPVAAAIFWPGVWSEVRRRPRLAVEALLFLALLPVGPLLRVELLGPALLLLYLPLRLAWPVVRRPAEATHLRWLDLFTLLLLALAAFLTLFCEILYVRDYYTNRFNTMMKFWYQIWAFYAIAGIYCAWRVLTWHRQPSPAAEQRPAALPAHSAEHRPASVAPSGRASILRLRSRFFNPGKLPGRPALAGALAPGSLVWLSADSGSEAAPGEPQALAPVSAPVEKTRRPFWLKIWLAALLILAVPTLAVPTLAYYQGAGYYKERKGLDGEKWYATTMPSDYQAMRWLRDYTRNNSARRGIVLEANGMNYSWANRISTYTGLPTIVGWPFHELQWRPNLDELEIWKPWLDMDKIYATTDIDEALALLNKHNVRYVFVGQFENGSHGPYYGSTQLKKFPPEGLDKFSQFMKPIYSDPANNVYIYTFE